jgi:hypothetical protein
MRRLVFFFVVALLGASVYGLTASSSAVAVSGASVSNSSFADELKAISTTPTLQCFMEALGNQSFSIGAGATTITSASAARWANMRIEGLAIEQYVKRYFHYTPNAQALAQATSSLEGEMTAAATSAGLSCPGTSVQAVAAMPSEMRKAEIEDQATSTYYISRLNGTIPVTLSSIKSYYASHVDRYDTICVSIALVSPSNLTAFTAAQAKGRTVAELAKQFSSDPSGAKGGAYGCYAPSNSSYASVRTDVTGTGLNTFPKNYQVINYNGGQYALFVAPTKVTVTPFANAASAVLSDIQTLNATNAKTQQENILYHSAVSINPAFGQWGPGTSGPSVFAAALPNAADVNAAKILRTATAATYK